MKRYIKSYLAFTPLIYRIAMFIIVPIATVGIGFYLGNSLMGNGASASVISASPTMAAGIVALFIPLIEIISDNWSFGGIQSKRSVNAVYLNTSYKGRDVLRRALCFDLIRKFIYEICIVGVTYLLIAAACIRRGASPNVYIFAWINLILTVHLFSVLGVWLARYGDLFWLNMVIAYFIQIPMVSCVFLIGKIERIFYTESMILGIIYVAITALLDVAASILSVKAAMRRYIKNYYDA